MYMYIYILYIYVDVYIHTLHYITLHYILTYLHTYILTYLPTYIPTYLHTYIYIYIFMCADMYMYLESHIYHIDISTDLHATCTFPAPPQATAGACHWGQQLHCQPPSAAHRGCVQHEGRYIIGV